jgi:hypothetical protein
MCRLVFYKALCLAFMVEKFTKHQLPQSGTPFLPSPVPELEFSPAGILLFLLEYRQSPREAINNVEAWMTMIREKRREAVIRSKVF